MRACLEEQDDDHTAAVRMHAAQRPFLDATDELVNAAVAQGTARLETELKELRHEKVVLLAWLRRRSEAEVQLIADAIARGEYLESGTSSTGRFRAASGWSVHRAATYAGLQDAALTTRASDPGKREV
jgi:hypothetical protein